MADKLKKFFSKKKTDMRFKMAGPGHKLADESESSSINTINTTSSTNSSSTQGIANRVESKESRVAAEAALARLNQQKRESAMFNTSKGAIQAQVRRELEEQKKLSKDQETVETASVVGGAAVNQPNLMEPTDDDLKLYFVADNVYFRCVTVSDEVLTRDEWRQKIREYVCEKFVLEPGLMTTLIIHSCNFNRGKVEKCIDTLCKYLENIINNPTDEKFHKIRLSNKVFCERVRPVDGAYEFLLSSGFIEQQLPGANEAEPHLVFDRKNEKYTPEFLKNQIDLLRTIEPITLELDRNVHVLLPGQVTSKTHLPDAFYALTLEEIKREHKRKMDMLERDEQLRTAAMRERDEATSKSELIKYKFAVIRIRFPNMVFLQGTFSVHEPSSAVYAFVSEHLTHAGPEFVLSMPCGTKMENNDDKSLMQLNLVPATLLNFTWDNRYKDQVRTLYGDSNVYLKQETMELIQEF